MSKRESRELSLRGGVFVIGEGITEQYYFSHLKRLKKFNCVVKPRFFGKTNISQIEKSVENLLLGGVSVICVFDADVSERNVAEKEKLRKFIKKFGKNKDVLICDSLPSIEFWFLLHFVKTNKYFHDSKAAERELRKFISDYSKSEIYLQKEHWAVQLSERLKSACVHAKSFGKEEGGSYSYIFKAIEELENQTL